VKLDSPIPQEYQKNGTQITYEHLTTHTAGIITGNFPEFKSGNPLSPYQGETIPIFKDLFKKTPLASEPGAQFQYSNIGVSLLGLILSEAAGKSYAELVKEKIFKLLHMNDSYLDVPDAQKARFLPPNVSDGKTLEPYAHWDLYSTAIAPAGGIRSTISDMAIYARAHLIPESSELRAAIERVQKPLFEFNSAHHAWIGMNWIIDPDKKLIWHNGSTIGFNSILAVSKKYNVAVVALTDTGVFLPTPDGHYVSDESFDTVVFDCLK